jgi:hypothetical protein
VKQQRVQRRLAAILAADVAGYSRLTCTDEECTIARLQGLRRELIDPAIAEHRGRIVKTTGDGILIEFASVVDAVRCAIEVQQGTISRQAEQTSDQRLEFRMGANVLYQLKRYEEAAQVAHEAARHPVADLYGRTSILRQPWDKLIGETKHARQSRSFVVGVVV